VTSAQDERAFRRFNAGRRYADQVRPWGFVMTVHAHPLVRAGSGPRVLVAPRDDDPAARLRAEWFDRTDPGGAPLRIRTGDPTFLVSGAVTVASYGDYFEEFRRHPERKAAGLDGVQCHSWTRGQLRPLEVEVTGLIRIGKEVPRLAVDPRSSDGIAYGPEEYRERLCAGCGKPVAADRRWCTDACRKRTERAQRQSPRSCGFCGKPLVPPARRWCDDRCRKRFTRRAYAQTRTR
jgi:predicted nucleic acid-binding Zn ribbon protein